MSNARQFFIDGKWVEPASSSQTLDVVNPATEETIDTIALGGSDDVDRAVAAARRAFETFGRTSRDDRIALLEKVIEIYKTRMDDIARTVSQEMGAPITLANKAQAPAGLGHLMYTVKALKEMSFEEDAGKARVIREPIGVVGMITPWNWPLNQISAKVSPALATGCTMILKPSETAPLNARIFAEVLEEAGVPAGVFNLVNGDGPTVGTALAAHPDIDMMSITGSTRAGISVAENAAPTVKRVTQELGGKSPNVLLDDVDFQEVVHRDAHNCFMNTGQSCNAPTRMLVPKDRMDEVAAIAKAAAESARVGDPGDEYTAIGPQAYEGQWQKVQNLIQKGIDEGAKLVAGGTGKPEGLDTGYYSRPTVFAHVDNDMTIAREEIFGPVLVILGYEDEADAVRIANDTVYGLSAYVSAGDPARAERVGRQIKAGQVHLNGASVDPGAPFGGYKQSGNGREFSRWGIEEFLETKALLGYNTG